MLYVVMGVLDDVVILGCSQSKTMAQFQCDQINKNGGIGYLGSEVWIEEYELTKDNYIEFD